MSTHSSLDAIQAFLAHKRIAMVGVSRNPRDFSVMLLREFCGRGYEVIPVNPNAPTILEKPCFARVQDIQPPVDAVLLMTSAEVTETAVRDCADAGVSHVWMYGPGTGGSVSPQALAFCREHGIAVVAGECPYMFFPKNGLHKVHGWVRKIAGSWPKRQAA